MRRAGLDVGSRAIKLVVWDGARVVHRAVADTGSDPLAVCRRLLDGAAHDQLVTTGYGRHLVRERWPGAETLTEIKAVAAGAAALHPGCRTVVDIGGQDSKIIALDAAGRVQRFAMNDRCAAGTGQFLEMMALALGYTREELVGAARGAPRGERLSSLCSVFAQSEVVSLIARGAPRAGIARGVHESIAARTAALAGGVPVVPPLVFTGGCAENDHLAALLAAALGHPLHIPEVPQTVAALGCALHSA